MVSGIINEMIGSIPLNGTLPGRVLVKPENSITPPKRVKYLKEVIEDSACRIPTKDPEDRQCWRWFWQTFHSNHLNEIDPRCLTGIRISGIFPLFGLSQGKLLERSSSRQSLLLG